MTLKLKNVLYEKKYLHQNINTDGFKLVGWPFVVDIFYGTCFKGTCFYGVCSYSIAV